MFSTSVVAHTKNGRLLKCPVDDDACGFWHVSFTSVSMCSYVSNACFRTFHPYVDYADDFCGLFPCDHVWKTRFALPGTDATLKKFLCLLHSLMWTPGEISRHFRILRPTFKDGVISSKRGWRSTSLSVSNCSGSSITSLYFWQVGI